MKATPVAKTGRHSITRKHDGSYKRIFAHKRTVRDLLRGFAGALSIRFDLSTLERLPASFVTDHLGQRHADMLWRVRSTDGKWVYLLVLLEFQSTVDQRMALRMLDYTVRVLQGLDRDDLDPAGKYPPVLPVVIYNGARRWNAATLMRDLFAPAANELRGYLPQHQYLLIDLGALDSARLPPANVVSLIAMLEQARSHGQLQELGASLAEWLRRIGETELLDSFGLWIRGVLSERAGPSGNPSELWNANEEESMSTLAEKVRKWGDELNQQWLEKGIEQGIERGRREGIEREKALVRRLAVRRFGAATASKIIPLLDQISDSERITAIADAVIEAETSEEFIARVQSE